MAERTDLLRVALAQINPTVGDIRGNSRKISDQIARARDEGAALVVFPELTVTGYPPEDLLLKTSFLDAADAALRELAAHAHGIVAVVGYPEKADDVYNAAAVLADGEVVATYRKMYLPNYGVFDEQRYFQSGSEAALVEVNGISIGLSICEDIWEPGPPAMTEALAGAQVIVNLSASPYRAGYGPRRERMLVQRAVDYLAAVVFVNTVGGQDELVFDGHSLAIDQDGEVIARAPQFEEALTLCTIDPRAISAARLRDTRHRVNVRRQRRASVIAEPPVFTLASVNTDAAGDPEVVSGELARMLEPDAEIYAALRTGLRDYVEKNDFERVVIALSGGIDSALAALLATDALGSERVTCVSMPSPYSSEGTRADARAIIGEPRRGLPRDRDRAGDGRLRRAAARGLRGQGAGRHGGEPPGAHPRQRRNGAVEQVRLARARDRQQVRDVGWLRHPLRRHGRRLRGAEGRLQGPGLPARALAKRAGGPRARAGLGARPCRPRPSSATSSATTSRCPPTTCSTRSSRATSRRTSTPSSSCTGAFRPPRWSA